MPTPEADLQRESWSLHDVYAMSALLLVMIVGGAVIGPVGDFPLNDDWAYALPVKWLTERGRLELTDWQSMTLVGQVYLAAGVTALTDFSFTALRILVMSLGAGSVLLVYSIARTAGSGRRPAVVAAAVLLANPILITASASFMTDVPFLFFSLLAIQLFMSSQTRGRAALLALAWLAVLAACSIRQLGIALAAGFVVHRIFTRGLDRSALTPVILPAIVVVAAVFAFPLVLKATIGVPSLYEGSTEALRLALQSMLRLELGYPRVALQKLLTLLAYLGLCLLPWLVLAGGRGHDAGDAGRRAPWPWTTTAVAAAVTLLLYVTRSLMPLAPNTIVDFGLGARTLPGGDSLPRMPPLFWAVVTFAAVLSVWVGLQAARGWLLGGPRTPMRRHDGLAILVLATSAIYNLPLLFSHLWFDRYVLLNVALACVMLAVWAPALRAGGRRRFAAGLVIGLYLGFGLAGTRDYLEWNRVRWSVIRHAETGLQARPADIDGGFEYNNYAGRLEENIRRPAGSVTIERPDAKYRIAFSALPGHRVVGRFKVESWMPGGVDSIYLLEPAR